MIASCCWAHQVSLADVCTVSCFCEIVIAFHYNCTVAETVACVIDTIAWYLAYQWHHVGGKVKGKACHVSPGCRWGCSSLFPWPLSPYVDKPPSPGCMASATLDLSSVTFPAAERHHPLAGTKLYCLMSSCTCVWTTYPRSSLPSSALGPSRSGDLSVISLASYTAKILLSCPPSF